MFGLAIACLAGAAGMAAESPASLAAERTQVQGQFPQAFGAVVDDPALPRVLLIGDSISIGYTEPVRALLKGVANVHRIPENGGPTTRGLQQLEEWLGDGRWDIIHFNFGLHDIKLDTEGRTQTPREEYAPNLRAITQRLQDTGARLIFATTTPVPETISSGPRRRDADVVRINAEARALMEELGVPVNDLYSIARPELAEIQRPANVHFTDEGSRVLAEPVAKAILALLRHREPGKP